MICQASCLPDGRVSSVSHSRKIAGVSALPGLRAHATTEPKRWGKKLPSSSPVFRPWHVADPRDGAREVGHLFESERITQLVPSAARERDVSTVVPRCACCLVTNRE